MATWDDVRAYIVSEYRVLGDTGIDVVLKFRVGERVQPVSITRYGVGGEEEWAVIESPIGRLEDVDLVRALEMVGDVTVGGLSLSPRADGHVLTLRHAMPISAFDVNELDIPLKLLVRAADAIEAALIGHDAQGV